MEMGTLPYLDSDPCGQAVDLDARLGEVGGRRGRRHNRHAPGPGVAGVPLDAVAVWLVAARVARHAEGVGAARVPHARVQA